MKLHVPDGVDAAAFDLSPRGVSRRSSAAVLCLHGLSGTPYEIRPVAERLADEGMRCRGPVLPGHRAHARELAETAYEAWLECARDELAALRKEHERVFIVGLSMGGVVSLKMSAEGLVDATAVVGTPLRLPRLIRWGLPVVKHLHPFLEKQTGASISDERARARHPGFPVMPLASVHQLVLLQRIVEDGLAKISTPLLVAHGARDTTANPGDARLIFDGVPSEHRELHMFERSAHIVPVDHEGAELADSVARFFGKHLG